MLDLFYMLDLFHMLDLSEIWFSIHAIYESLGDGVAVVCRLDFPKRGSGASRGLTEVIYSGLNGPQSTGMELTRKLVKNWFFGYFNFLGFLSLAGVPILGGGLPWPFMGITGGLMCGSMPHWPCLLVYKKEFGKELEYVQEAMSDPAVSR